MKLFKPVTIKMDDETLDDLETIVASEKRANPRHTVSKASVVRGLIQEKARRVTRQTHHNSA